MRNRIRLIGLFSSLGFMISCSTSSDVKTSSLQSNATRKPAAMCPGGSAYWGSLFFNCSDGRSVLQLHGAFRIKTSPGGEYTKLQKFVRISPAQHLEANKEDVFALPDDKSENPMRVTVKLVNKHYFSAGYSGPNEKGEKVEFVCPFDEVKSAECDQGG